MASRLNTKRFNLIFCQPFTQTPLDKAPSCCCCGCVLGLHSHWSVSKISSSLFTCVNQPPHEYTGTPGILFDDFEHSQFTSRLVVIRKKSHVQTCPRCLPLFRRPVDTNCHLFLGFFMIPSYRRSLLTLRAPLASPLASAGVWSSHIPTPECSLGFRRKAPFGFAPEVVPFFALFRTILYLSSMRSLKNRR